MSKIKEKTIIRKYKQEWSNEFRMSLYQNALIQLLTFTELATTHGLIPIMWKLYSLIVLTISGHRLTFERNSNRSNFGLLLFFQKVKFMVLFIFVAINYVKVPKSTKTIRSTKNLICISNPPEIYGDPFVDVRITKYRIWFSNNFSKFV